MGAPQSTSHAQAAVDDHRSPVAVESFRRGVWKLLRGLLLMTILCLSLFVFLQRKLIYVPTCETVTTAMAGGLAGQVDEVAIVTNDGLSLKGWHIVARPGGAVDAASRRLTLYFPGNAAHRGRRGKQLEMLIQLGSDVLIVDYRGYGDNPGTPSEIALCQDARSTWNHAVETLKYRPEQIVLFGESLGGGVATALAHELTQAGTTPGGLILRATFSSLPDAAAYHYPYLPVNWLLVDRFPSIHRIPAITCPLLVLHGDQDQVIPFAQSQQLFAAAPEKSANGVTKTLVRLAGAGHNDILYVAADQMEAALRAFHESLP